MTTIALSPPAPRTRPLGDDDYQLLYEIVDGQRVELAPMSILASRVASNLLIQMGYYLHSNPIGEASIETLFKLPLPGNRNRRPDIAFVSAKTIAAAPAQLGSENAWAVLPELMVEVVSPHDLAEDIIERIGEYFAAGTKLMWVVYPTQRLIYIYDSAHRVRILTDKEDLDGAEILPGFRIPIASLFPA